MQEIIDLFGLVQGSPDILILYFVCIVFGMIGASLRVFFDHKDEIKNLFEINDSITLYFFKFMFASMMGAIIGYFMYPSFIAALTTGYVSAYSFRYILAKLATSDVKYVKYSIAGFRSFLENDIKKTVMKFSGVREVKVIDPKKDGKVFIVIDSNEKPVPEAKLKEMVDAVDQYDLFGVDYILMQTELLPVSIKAKLLVTDVTKKKEVEDKVTATIQAYFNNLMIKEPAIEGKINKNVFDSCGDYFFQDFKITESIPAFSSDGIISVEKDADGKEKMQVLSLGKIEFV